MNKTLLESTESIFYDDSIEKFDSLFCNLIICLMSTGLLGNIVSFCVFLKRKLLVHKCNWYLLILTIFEVLFCLIVLTDYLFSKFYIRPIFLHDYSYIASVIIDFTIHTSDLCSNILTLFLALDRLYAIKHPLRIQEFITHSHSKKLVFISLSTLVLMKSVSFSFCQLNISYYSFSIYCSIVSYQLFYTIPIIIILILNGFLVKELMIYFRHKPKSTINEEDDELSECIGKYQRKVKIRQSQKFYYFMILFLNIYCILASIPYYFLITYLKLVELNFLLNHFDLKSILTIQIITSALFNSNHCINFFIYLSFKKLFFLNININDL
jgi:hypothetical protein